MSDKKVTSFKIERHHSHSWSYEYTIDGKHRDIIADSLHDLKKIVLARSLPWEYEVDLNDWLKKDYAEDRISRRAAVERITDESVLVDLAKNASDIVVRIIAINKINDESILADIVENDSDIFVRVEAAKKINDESFLANIAKRYWKNRYACMAAVRKIEDESVLADVAKNASDSNVRIEAISRISDESVVVDIVKNDFDHDIRIRSVDKITDETILVNLDKIDPNLRLVRVKPVVKKKKSIDFTKGRIFYEQVEDAWEEHLEEEAKKWDEQLDQLLMDHYR